VRRNRFASPLRYPGGKGALASYWRELIVTNDLEGSKYVEIYAGGAGVAWPLLFEEYVSEVHINDIDIVIFSFWDTVLNHTETLCKTISDTRVDMAQWYKQKHINTHPSEHNSTDIGFSTFFLNRTNRSGIITGGVIGGKNQSGKWLLDARYNKHDLIGRIEEIAKYKHRITVTRQDAAEVIQSEITKPYDDTVIYLDPPYYSKGKGLYQNDYTADDHRQIASLVARLECPWLVSYDATPEIFALYSQFDQLTYDLSYSAQTRYAGNEVLIYSPLLTIPTTEDVLHP